MPAIEKIDWDAAFDAWILIHRPKGILTQQAYAQSLGVAPTWLSTRFNEIERIRKTDEIKQKMPKVLQQSLDKIEEGLEFIKPEELASTSARVFSTIADRLGMSPQAQVIQIQQNNANQTILVPLFEGEVASKAEKIFESETDLYPEGK